MAPGWRAINQLLLSVLNSALYEHKCTWDGHPSCNIQFKIQAVYLYVCVWGGAVLGVTMHIQAIQMGVGRLEARREKVGYVEFYYKTP